jgi:hypothetical protein
MSENPLHISFRIADQSDTVFRADLASIFRYVLTQDRSVGEQVFPVTDVIISANRTQGIFWRISVVSPPIRSWYVCLCVPGGAFRSFRPTPAAPRLPYLESLLISPHLHQGSHRQLKRLTGPGLGFGGFWTARRTLAGYEAMAMIRKGQVRNIGGSDIRVQAEFIAGLFQVAA